MLIGRWKSKDKSSGKSSSGGGGAGKKKRKFGREGKEPTTSTFDLPQIGDLESRKAEFKIDVSLVGKERLVSDRKNFASFGAIGN